MQKIHLLAKEGNIRELRRELDRGADVDVIYNKTGATSLHIAAHNYQPEAVSLLVERNANIYAKDNTLSTPFHDAIRHFVLSAYKTPLYEKYSKATLQICRILLRHENKIKRNQPKLIDCKNGYDKTPLDDAKSDKLIHDGIEKILAEIRIEELQIISIMTSQNNNNVPTLQQQSIDNGERTLLTSGHEQTSSIFSFIFSIFYL